MQDTFSPNSVCFGCGPKNPEGLHLRSFPEGNSLVATWEPGPHHSAFSDFASGGIVSALLDCHGNWTAAYTLMKSRRMDSPPGTVTAQYTVRFLRPTPVKTLWNLVARPTRTTGEKVWVRGELLVNQTVTARMNGLFVAVGKSHPAFHRWR